MDKSKIKNFQFFNGIICLSKWVRKFIFIIFAAFVIGFTNAFNEEFRWINDSRNFVEQEQVIDDEDINE